MKANLPAVKNELTFDYDVYKILVRYLLREKTHSRLSIVNNENQYIYR